MQGTVATRFAFGDQFNEEFVENLNLNATVNGFVKIDQHLSKLWAEMRTSLFDSQYIVTKRYDVSAAEKDNPYHQV